MSDPHDPSNPGPGQQFPNQGQQYPNQGQQYPNQGQGYPDPNQGQQFPNQGQQQYANQGQQFAGQAGGQGYPMGDPPAATPPKKGTGGLIATILVMALIGGAIGFFGGPLVLDTDDDAADVATTEASGSTTTAAPVADPLARAEVNGLFQASMPEGWTVTSAGVGTGRFALQALPGAAGSDAYEQGGMTVTMDRRPGMTPVKVLDEAGKPKKCSSEPVREPFTQGDYTGLAERYATCENGFQNTRLVVTLPGGEILLVTGPHKGDESNHTKALESFVAPAGADTKVAITNDCATMADSDEAEFPLNVAVMNYMDKDVQYGWVDPATGQIDDEDQTVPAGGGFIGGRHAKEGDVFRFHWEGGQADYTATAEKHQCAVLNPDGKIVPVPTS